MARASLSYLSQRVLTEHEVDGERFVDYQADLVVEHTGEVLISVGGVWDNTRKRYAQGRAPARRLVLEVHRGQVGAARWFASWLRRYLRGDRQRQGELALLALFLHGARRSGKGDLAVKAMIVFAVGAPRGIIWVISDVEEDDQELREALESALPPTRWYRFYESENPPYYLFRNGSKVFLRSGAKPQKLRAGRVDLVFLNEGQKLDEACYSNVIVPLQDKGGLCIVASNWPRPSDKGKWVRSMVRRCRAKKQLDVALFEMDPRDNPHFRSERLEQLRTHMTADDYERDVRGNDPPDREKVFYTFDEAEHVRAAGISPFTGRVLENVTAAFLERVLGRDHFDHLIGMDFDKHPHIAATIKHAFDDDEPDPRVRPFHLGGEPLLWSVRIVLVEPGNEKELCQRLLALDLDPERCAIVADATGEYQGIERVRGRGSWDELHKHGFRWVFAPDPAIVRDREKKQDRGIRLNPHIADRVAVGNARLRETYLDEHGNPAGYKIHEYIDGQPELEPLVEALREWPNKNGVPFRKSLFAHRCDSWSYPTYRCFPRRLKLETKFDYESLGPRQRSALTLFPRSEDDDDE